MILGTKSEVLHDIGERMRKRRLRLNLSRAEAAERSGICESTLKNFEVEFRFGGSFPFVGLMDMMRGFMTWSRRVLRTMQIGFVR